MLQVSPLWPTVSSLVGDKLECLCFTAFSPLEAGFYNFLRFHFHSGPIILEPSFGPFQAYPERLYITALSL